MDDYGNVKALNPDEWRERRDAYIEIAEKHLETCRYKDANVYVRQKQFWEVMKASSATEDTEDTEDTVKKQ